MSEPNQGQKPKKVTIHLDGENLVLESPDTTPNEILQLAGLDPATHYLVEIKGRQQDSLQGQGAAAIHVKDGDKFISLSTGPTPTS